ncbi:MAG: hypothetical protein U1F26_18125 [Lysobacterales bacterium]
MLPERFELAAPLLAELSAAKASSSMPGWHQRELTGRWPTHWQADRSG